MIVNATMAAALKKSVDEGYKLKISAEMNTVDSDTPISITPDDIQQNSFSIDRYVQTGNTLEVGSACSSELKFIIYNGEKFKGVTFEGAEVIVSGTIPVENSDGEWVDTTVNLGTFTIDEKPRSLALVQIVALDDMVKLDKPCTISDTGTMKTLILSMASECGVNVDTTSLNTCFNAYNNITVTLKFSSETVPTYRQVLSWICQLGLCNAYINVDGYLAFKGFTGSTVSAKITADDRYTHTIEEKAIGVKEFTFAEDDLTVTIPQGGNTAAENCIVLDFSKNPLFKPFYEKLSAIAGAFTTWKNKLKTFAYIPFSANIRNFFWLEPMDKITFAKDGTNYETLIMHTTLCPGKAMKIEAKGESPTKSGYAAVNPLTAQEQKILDDLRRFVTAETAKVTDREYQLIEFNKAINSGMALHKTTVNGVEYYHDQEDITLSDYIMVQNSAGVAWTDSGWNSGSPVWKYGISSNGEAILNSVDAYKIRADLITVTDLKAFGATIGGWNIGEEAIYKDVGTYRAYLQSPGVAGLDTWILSAQKLDDLANPNFFLTMRGELYLASDLTAKGYITSPNKATFANTTISENVFAGVLHRRDGAESAFGVGVVSDKKTAALETKETGGKVNARIDIYDGGGGDCVVLGTTQFKSVNSNGDDTFYRSYLTFSSGCLYTGGPASSYSPSNRLNFMAKNIYANDINVGGVANIDYAQCETLVIPIDGSYGDVGGWLSALLTRIENLEGRVKNL